MRWHAGRGSGPGGGTIGTESAVTSRCWSSPHSLTYIRFGTAHNRRFNLIVPTLRALLTTVLQSADLRGRSDLRLRPYRSRSAQISHPAPGQTAAAVKMTLCKSRLCCDSNICQSNTRRSFYENKIVLEFTLPGRTRQNTEKIRHVVWVPCYGHTYTYNERGDYNLPL